MSKPPKTIDNAEVLYWAWSGEIPFGTLKSTNGSIIADIFGLAICVYRDSDSIYRFSCDNEWESEQDSDYSSIEEAMNNLPEQYKNVPANWRKYE